MLTGRTTQLLYFLEQIRKIFREAKVLSVANAEEVLAYGAAKQAAILDGRIPLESIQDHADYDQQAMEVK